MKGKSRKYTCGPPYSCPDVMRSRAEITILVRTSGHETSINRAYRDVEHLRRTAITDNIIRINRDVEYLRNYGTDNIIRINRDVEHLRNYGNNIIRINRDMEHLRNDVRVEH